MSPTPLKKNVDEQLVYKLQMDFCSRLFIYTGK